MSAKRMSKTCGIYPSSSVLASTLEATMNRRTGSLVAAILAIATVPTAAQWLNYPTPGIPRTPDGKPNLSAPAPRKDGNPDLSGIWRGDRQNTKYFDDVS